METETIKGRSKGRYKMKTRLVGTSSTKKGLEKIINEYLYSTNWIIKENLELYNKKTEKTASNYRVVQKKNRWRFENV